MKDNDKPTGNKNPAIQSMLEHLAKETILPEKVNLWPAVRANLAASKTLWKSKELLMNKKFTFTALAAVLVLSITVVFLANNVTTVSAEEILDRASQTQTQTMTNQGIRHVRIEAYDNLEGKSDGQGGNTIVESYSDPASGNFRVVITDKKTGDLLVVLAFDGSNAYNTEGSKSGQPGAALLTVYRSPQGRPSLIGTTFADHINGESNAALDAEAKSMFGRMRQNPHVELVGKETWDNGHTVYALRSQQEVRSYAENDPMGLVTLYFDVKTYQLLGSRASIEKDGKEVLISRQQILLDEILPADSQIAWDLSDLQGIDAHDAAACGVHGDWIGAGHEDTGVFGSALDRAVSFHAHDTIHQRELTGEERMEVGDAFVDARPVEDVFRPAVS